MSCHLCSRASLLWAPLWSYFRAPMILWAWLPAVQNASLLGPCPTPSWFAALGFAGSAAGYSDVKASRVVPCNHFGPSRRRVPGGTAALCVGRALRSHGQPQLAQGALQELRGLQTWSWLMARLGRHDGGHARFWGARRCQPSARNRWPCWLAAVRWRALPSWYLARTFIGGGSTGL